MKIRDIIVKLLHGEELNALERAEIEGFDPDGLREKLEEAERARMSREEVLQHDLKSVCAERDELRSERDSLQRERQITRLAADSGCTDAAYLDFLAVREKLALDDDKAVAEFISRVERENPHCFKSRLKPGTGNPELPSSSGTGESLRSGDRITAIVDALNCAPDSMQ